MTTPATMFMHWKVPTRLIVDEPSYQRQKAALLADSNQRFYEDINGTRENMPVGHEVLSEVGRLRQMSPQKLAKLPSSWHSAFTNTTHYSTPYNMFKQIRERDLEQEIKESVKLEKQQQKVTKLPAVPSSSSGVQLTQQTIARSLNPKAVPAAENWLRSVGKSEKKVIQNALHAADKSYVDTTLKRTLQPDARKAVETWMEGANAKDREVAIQFFGSLAGSKLMGMKEGLNHHLHKDHKGEVLCKMCDGDKLQQVLTALRKGKPVASVTLNKSKQTPDKLRHLRLLTPCTRNRKEEFQTWHHLPSFKHPGPVSNTIALFTRPHRPIQRHFTIHPEWE
ncbi:uncharacterized protein [Apostichopus japonicus]|uniref:uncharacterized protein isoform X3 n=1 Tax=Stichopus japonicus TaxID=307972 RepID=UPI003AB3D90E